MRSAASRLRRLEQRLAPEVDYREILRRVIAEYEELRARGEPIMPKQSEWLALQSPRNSGAM